MREWTVEEERDMRKILFSIVLASTVALPFVAPAGAMAQNWYYNPSRVTVPYMFMPYTTTPYTYPYYEYLPNRQPTYGYNANQVYSYTPGYSSNYTPYYMPVYPNYGSYYPAPNFVYVR